jgi:hypothetical protein
VRPQWWFRISALLLIFFALGHTVGFLTFRAPTAEGRALWEAMKNTRFSGGHGSFSYGDFYVGFGLFITAYLLFTAWLAWMIGSQENTAMQRQIAWSMVLLQLVGLGLALRYFSAPPALLSALTVFTLAAGASSLQRKAGRTNTQS